LASSCQGRLAARCGTQRHGIRRRDLVDEEKNVGISSGLLEEFLHPFPTFKSRHLGIDADSRVSNRELIALRDWHVDHDQMHVSVMYTSFAQFNEQLLVARWMCKNPEQRLYTKRFDPLPPQSVNEQDDDAISVQTDLQSHTGICLAFFPKTIANTQIRNRDHPHASHYMSFLTGARMVSSSSAPVHIRIIKLARAYLALSLRSRRDTRRPSDLRQLGQECERSVPELTLQYLLEGVVR
jgi:hypothetical protein